LSWLGINAAKVALTYASLIVSIANFNKEGRVTPRFKLLLYVVSFW
jgi:hypothetical protein